jgi:hypothetical protein
MRHGFLAGRNEVGRRRRRGARRSRAFAGARPRENVSRFSRAFADTASECGLRIKEPTGTMRKVAVTCADGRIATPILFDRPGAYRVQFADSLEQSPSHLAAMLGAFDSVGLGMALDEEHRVYLTEFFAAAQSR